MITLKKRKEKNSYRKRERKRIAYTVIIWVRGKMEENELWKCSNISLKVIDKKKICMRKQNQNLSLYIKVMLVI